VSIVHETIARRIVFGEGAVAELPSELARLGLERPLVIAGNSHAGHAERLLAAVGGGASIIGVRVHVPAALAEDARAKAREVGAGCLVAIGGGSAVGLAKAVALTDGLPIAAVPTTYAGSELTTVWGLTEDGRKTTGRDPGVAPRLVIYDPALTYDLPAEVTAASGMNAVAHCVEALWAPGATPVTDGAATEGLRRLATGIRGSLRDPHDAGARATALAGAWLAGEAFAAAARSTTSSATCSAACSTCRTPSCTPPCCPTPPRSSAGGAGGGRRIAAAWSPTTRLPRSPGWLATSARRARWPRSA
jgi:maleylacetate reductase